MKAKSSKSANQAINLTDFYDFGFLSGLNQSPSGSKAIFVKTSCNPKENAYRRNLYLLSGDKATQLTSDGESSLYLFDDDDTVLFASFRNKEDKQRREKGDEFTPFYRINLQGGEAIKAFTLPYSVSSIKKISEGLYLISGSLNLNYLNLLKAKDKEREEILETRKKEADYEVLDEYPFWFNGGGVINKTRSCLFLYDEKKDESTLITKPTFGVACFDFANGEIYYAGNDQKAVRKMEEGLYSYTIKNKKTKSLIRPAYTIHDVKCFNGQILLAASDNKTYGLNQNPSIYLYNLKKGSLTLLKDIDECIGCMVGSDCHLGRTTSSRVIDGAYFYITTTRNRSVLRKLDQDGNLSTVIDKEGALLDFDIRNGEILAIADYDMRLSEVYGCSIGDSKPRKITSMNDAALSGKYVAKPNKMTIKSQGFDIDGWVLLPKDYNPNKKYPAILDVHGGPKTVYGEVYYHEMQLWANSGYLVFFSNPFGGDGRGNKFADLRGKYGSIDYDNLMDFTDAVLKKYPCIDNRRLYVTGGSYGGFMTNWIITHTNRFAGACTQRSISNWVSMSGISDIGIEFSADQNGGDIYSEEGIKALWEHSPLKYIDNAKTPTLIIHSECDYRCPIAEGYQLYSGLIHNGVETRMVVFHGENHELSRSGKPLHRERRLREITDWFNMIDKRIAK